MERHVIAEAFQAAFQSSFSLHVLAFIEIVRSQFLIGFVLGEHVINHDEDGMSEGDQCTLLPSTSSNASLVSRQVGVLGLGSHMRDLDEDLA